MPEHRRGEEGVVPNWSVNDLVFHNGKWAGVAAEKLARIRDTGSAGEDDPDEVWRGKNELWAAESKSMLYQEAMSRALADREAAREALHGAPRGHRRSSFLVQRGDVRPLPGAHGGSQPFRRQPRRSAEVTRMHVSLRPLVDADLDAIYEQMKDPESVRMAAFTAEDPADRHAFLVHMSRVRDDPSAVQHVIEADGTFAGTIGSFIDRRPDRGDLLDRSGALGQRYRQCRAPELPLRDH